VVAAGAVGLLCLSAASGAVAPTRRVSLAASGAQGNGHSLAAAVSADGRYVAFYSSATNLVPGDTNKARDVFVRDTKAGMTTRISVAAAGTEADGNSFEPAISADGRYVAFHSDASNLVPGDNNGADDVFVKDRQTGATTRVSVNTAGAEADGGSYTPAMSADGRLVAFLSDATNIVPGDTNQARDVFVHDVATGTTSRVSVNTAGDQAQGGPSASPEISADGRYVAFSSFAFSLVSNDTNFTSDIFVHDNTTGTTTRVSVDEHGFELDGDSFSPSLSADGRYVAYSSDASFAIPDDTNDTFDVFVYDRQTGIPRRESVDDAGRQAEDASVEPSLSGDGRFLAFASDAPNLVPGDTNGSTDIFVHDNISGATTRASVANSGDESGGDSARAALTANGRFVVFDSNASNLVPGDSNRFTDVFRRDITAGPPPPPKARCKVPRVIGLKLAAARRHIVKAHCRVGRVRHVHSKRVGRVVAQSPRAGAVRPRGTRVSLTVGRR
jgi:Tol biopolymer transport system component